jgi:hypothetical protein
MWGGRGAGSERAEEARGFSERAEEARRRLDRRAVFARKEGGAQKRPRRLSGITSTLKFKAALGRFVTCVTIAVVTQGRP